MPVVFAWAALASVSLYAIFMLVIVYQARYTFFDGLAATFLLFGIAFVLVHGIGYTFSVIKAARDENSPEVPLPQGYRAPRVACLISTFNEPLEVVRGSVAALRHMRYPNAEIVILDDSTQQEVSAAMRDMAAEFGVTIRQRTDRRGYKAGAINDFIAATDAEYVALFDADALATPDFLREIVPLLMADSRLAFVQTPQHYANTQVSEVASAAAHQQAVFYEYVCQGKNQSQATFCCGTNVVLRRAALQEVGGFDETSVVEDFATSLQLHMHGHSSAYRRKVYIYSLAPATLSAYMTQQSRWAFGTVSDSRKVLRSLLQRRKSMRLGQWWEYFLSSTYYWIGWVNFIFMVIPLLYLFFRIQPIQQDVVNYVAVFLPYIFFTLNVFYAGLTERGYRVRALVRGQQMAFICFPLHMTSAFAGIIGMKRPFKVTPKGHSQRLQWTALWPQLVMLAVSSVALLYGLDSYLTGRDSNTAAVILNSLWAMVHVWLLSALFRFNQPLTLPEARRDVGTPGGTPGGANESPMPANAARRPVLTYSRLAIAATLGLLVPPIATILHWYVQPTLPVNVYILDRTGGPRFSQHRTLSWSLNFLKVRKHPDFDPGGAFSGPSRWKHADYRYQHDFYGFRPYAASSAFPDPERQGDLLSFGSDRPLPQSLEAPGLLYLADCHGEYLDYDAKRKSYIRYANRRRGLSADEIYRIVDFSQRGGLVIGEWNTLGYPTLPGGPMDPQIWEAKLADPRRALAYVHGVELPRRERDLRLARQWKNPRGVAILGLQIQESRDKIASLRRVIEAGSVDVNQLAAQRKLEDLLHVHYLQWYGRYIDNFAEVERYDLRLWQNLRSYVLNDPILRAKYPRGVLQGSGFVFYRDGPSKAIGEDGLVHVNPFSTPVIITQDEVDPKAGINVATIQKSAQKSLEDDPLLNDVAARTPYRYWFDVVEPTRGGQTLASYVFRIKESAGLRLQAAGFPRRYLDFEGDVARVTMPALVVGRDEAVEGQVGRLHSIYLAGDASSYSSVTTLNEVFPATGGLTYFVSRRFGPVASRYYWNYYQPLLRNVFLENGSIRRDEI